MANKHQMLPEELQALRDQAVVVGLRDVELGRFLQQIITAVAHAHGLDPAEEDERMRDELADRKEDARKKQERIHGKEELSPAQEESKRIAKEQGKPYAPGHHEQLDPVAKETQDKGTGTVPTMQAEEAELEKGAPNVQPASVSTLKDFSSASSKTSHDGKPHHGKEGKH